MQRGKKGDVCMDHSVFNEMFIFIGKSYCCTFTNVPFTLLTKIILIVILFYELYKRI